MAAAPPNICPVTWFQNLPCCPALKLAWLLGSFCFVVSFFSYVNMRMCVRVCVSDYVGCQCSHVDAVLSRIVIVSLTNRSRFCDGDIIARSGCRILERVCITVSPALSVMASWEYLCSSRSCTWLHVLELF